MAADYVSFDPEDLYSSAQVFESAYNNLIGYFGVIHSKYQALSNQWQSASSDLFLDKYSQLMQTEAKILTELQQDYQHLYTVSGIYKSVENNAKQTSESLPTDGIFNN